MKLLFKQRFFSWLDSYDVYDEQGLTLFSVEGKLGWGHRLHIMDASGRFVGEVKEVVLTLLPRFELYLGETCVGSIQKEFSLFKPRFSMDVNGWSIRGDWQEWDYEICDLRGNIVATVSKQLFN